MSEQINNGGSAFPMNFIDGPTGQICAIGGMTLRDYFAAKAMQSLILTFAEVAMQTGQKPTRSETARIAFGYADSMLAARGDA